MTEHGDWVGRFQGPGMELCSHTIDHNLLTWTHLPAEKVGTFSFPVCQGKFFLKWGLLCTIAVLTNEILITEELYVKIKAYSTYRKKVDNKAE